MNGLRPPLTAPPGFAVRQSRSDSLKCCRPLRSEKATTNPPQDLTDEKHYPLGTTDEYFQAPEPDEEYILTLCRDTVIFSSGLLAEALSRLDEREREMIYLSFFKRIPQHEIGRQYGRSRSTAGYHIRKALRQLQAEMEGMAHEE